MQWHKLIWLSCFLLSCLGLAAPAQNDAQGAKKPVTKPGFVPNEWIAVYDDDMSDSDFDSTLASMQAVMGDDHEILHKFNFAAFRGVSFRAEMTQNALDHISNLEGIQSIEANPVLQLDQRYGEANKTQYFGVPYNLDRISHRTLDPSPYTYIYNELAGSAFYIYVVDSGVDVNNNEFLDNLGRRAFLSANFVTGEPAGDFNGHGTNVAGIAAGKEYGVAKEALILDVKVFNGSGKSTGSSTLQGIEYTYNDASSNGRVPESVVNLSLGTNQTISPALDHAVQTIINGGLFVAVSAGNEFANARTTSPARVLDACTVGALTSYDHQAHFSNYGFTVDIWAPGVDIVAAAPGGKYATAPLSGTSQACPHVAGVATLFKRYNHTFKHMSPVDLCRTLQDVSTKNEILYYREADFNENNYLLFNYPGAYGL